MSVAKAPDRSDVAVRLDSKIASQVRLISAHRKVSVAKILGRILEKPIDRQYREMLAELNPHASQGQ